MGIRDVPTSFAAMDGLAREYEAMHRYAAESNRRVAAGALTAITRLVPAPLAGLGAQLVCALLEAPVREACGLAGAPRAVAWALGGLTAARRVIAAPS